jgi:DNA polymerase (family 10)
VREVVSAGETRSSLLLRSALQVDVRLVERAAFGSAVLYFTGSKAHGIRLRRRAQERDYKLNEYGLFAGEKRVAGKDEAEVYERLDLPFIPPELREDRGEIKAAERDRLPQLITLDDIRGNLHSHTDASDGKATLEEMADAAKAKGWSYLAVTDHSKAVRVANGLTEERLAKQIDAVDALNEKLDGITLLKSCEVDILGDGELDLPDDILERLDLVVCSVHSRFELSEEKQTTRILKALDHPCCSILAHPTGRLLGSRQGYAVDVGRLIEKAVEVGCALELNAQPQRLDLDDAHCRMAKEAGVKLSIATDAHATAHLDFMADGIAQARRGWLEPGDVLNTLNLRDLRQALRRP